MQSNTFLRLTFGEWALVGLTMIWGATFLIIRTGLEASGPFFFLGTRYACAALIMLPLSFSILRGLTLHEVIAGAVIGVSLFLATALQTVGLLSITASKSVFITTFYVPAVPIIQWLLLRRRPKTKAWLGIGCAFIGLLLLSGPDGVSMGFGKGELLTYLSTVAIAFEIVLISFFAGAVNVRRVTIVQVLVTSFLGFLFMPVYGESIPPFSWLLVFTAGGLGLASAIIQFVMNWAQRTISPTRATVIYAGEPVWGGLFGHLAGERLPLFAFVGCAFIVAGVLISDFKFSRKSPAAVQKNEKNRPSSHYAQKQSKAPAKM